MGEHKFDSKSCDILWQMMERRAFLLNDIDKLNGVYDENKKYYPMMHYYQYPNRYKPDVHRFGVEEYKIYWKKLKKQMEQHQIAQHVQEKSIKDRLFEQTNKKMTQYLLSRCDKIKRNVGELGIFYHEGRYNANSEIWSFDGEQKEEYGHTLGDYLNWYNSHDNKQFNDNKFGFIVYKKCEKDGSVAFIPEFKRLTYDEYKVYAKRFEAECANSRKEHVDDDKESAVFRRVISLDFNGSDRKRKRDDDEYDVDGPQRKRQRLSEYVDDEEDDDDIVINGMNHNGKGHGYDDFCTPQ